MKHYFYAENGQQFGPFTLEVLKDKKIKKSTLVWTEGIDDWAKAETFEELKSMLVLEPPPLPKSIIEEPRDFSRSNESLKPKEKPVHRNFTDYDLNYKKEIGVTIVGVVLLIIPLVIAMLGGFTAESVDEYNRIRITSAIVAFFIRIIVCIWVEQIAIRQNRNSMSWCLLAFFFPSITLIIIGLSKKLSLKIEVDEYLPLEDQVLKLYAQAQKLFSHNRFVECIEVLNVASRINTENFEIYLLRAQSYIELENYPAAKIDLNFLNENGQLQAEANLLLGNIAILKYERELAVSFWEKAKELDDAQVQLTLYNDFTGKYVLDELEAYEKLNKFKTKESNFLGRSKYLGGLPEIDDNDLSTKIYAYDKDRSNQFYVYDNGIYFTLSTSSKIHYVAIAFYEIEDICLNKSENKLELRLTDSKVVGILYNQKIDTYNFLNGLLIKYEKATGKIPTAKI
ncbi:MAG: DUF4339 domain-containing protein [Bacteroidales bacterium]|nr:DUF4339 domain-containing protein [Bacteroidales bacterium]